MWVDLGLVNLVDAIMNGPQTLYEMPEGSFLSQIRFTDDPDSVYPDNWPHPPVANLGNGIEVKFGTVKSFGWYGFASVNLGNDIPQTNDSLGFSGADLGYGPFAALDAGASDFASLVLSAASVGPVQAALSFTDNTVEPNTGEGSAVRVAAITAWVATTAYDSPQSNTVATPGALQKCMILANGTLWVNDGLTGTSGGSAPDFAGNAGGSVTDGPDIIWYDTGATVPTVGAVHLFAEIIMPVVSASPGSIYASVVKKGSVTVAVKNKGNIVANVIQ